MKIISEKVDGDMVRITGMVETGRSGFAVFERIATWVFSLDDGQSLIALADCLEGIAPDSCYEARE